jgi:aryl-alcohol dehydrogenase-like predicted oxidoreductase
VTARGLGGAGLGGSYGPADECDAVETVHAAIERGINYIDTSPLYGQSERRIGLALEGSLRDKVRLSTKTGTHPDRRGDYSRDGTLWSVENSLRLLKTGYLDVVLVHDPDDLDPAFAPGGALEALEELKAQRVIGGIGLGVRSHAFHRRAIESGRFDLILTYNDYHPLRTAALPLLELARRHDVGVLNGSPLAHGLLIGEDPDALVAKGRLRPPERDLNAARTLYRWCRERGLPMPGVVLQFCLRQPLIGCTLTGAKTPGELEQNLRGTTTPLPESVWTELEALNLTEGQEPQTETWFPVEEK